MNESKFSLSAAARTLVGLFNRLATGLAALSAGRLLLLCLLALVAAGVLEDILAPSGQVRSSHAPVKIVVKKSGEAQEPAKQGKHVQIVIDADSKADEQPGLEAEPQATDAAPASEPQGVAIVGKVFLLLILLWAVRIVTRSKQNAEQCITVAQADAAMEALRRQVAEAQLQTLQAQVEPHFLFNTLASVEHLTETEPARARLMVQHLIGFLRGSLPKMRKESTTLGEEVELCRSYLAIMQLRMEDRLSVSIDIPQALQAMSFPPMMLQSLVENAIKHGLEPKPEGGAVALSATLQGGKLRVSVADTGLGIADNAGAGVGLSNIRERLQRLYGATAALVLAANAPTGAHITIEIPCESAARDPG